MDSKHARELLSGSAGDEEPVHIPAAVLAQMTVDDLSEDVAVELGDVKDGVVHSEWDGRLVRRGTAVVGEVEYLLTRTYWYSPLGLEQCMDLVRRAVEARQRTQADVEFSAFEDDGAYIRLSFSVLSDQRNLGRADAQIRRVVEELEEAADRATDEIGITVANVAARLSGWGSESLDQLVIDVETAKSADGKGRSLEELCSRIFESVPGLTVAGRIRTETEEIDISVINDATDARLRREGALIIAECKNWTGKCGKNEFTTFRAKIENRNRRCTLGFLVSWHGFAETVTKEMLRGSREDCLVVPVTGADIRAAVQSRDFSGMLAASWDRAVRL